ncbi:MAG: exodeoxyribonuclease VII small subunit [Oscillospiraceae bacterium]|nr:exodeoxyribonuclease VII small subunit [Oscillospiraceae bacterium]
MITDNNIEDINFEQALKELETIVRALESGTIALDDSLENFENGIKLIRRCNLLLDNAERKVKKLTRAETGEVVEEDFTPN